MEGARRRRRRLRAIASHIAAEAPPSRVEAERQASADRNQRWQQAYPSPTGPSPTRQLSEREFTIGPLYAPAPELERAAGVPRGTTRTLAMSSTDSAIYPGVARRPSDPTKDLEINDPRFRGLGLSAELFKGDAEVQGWCLNCAPGTPELSQPGVVPYEREVVVHLPAGHDPAEPS